MADNCEANDTYSILEEDEQCVDMLTRLTFSLSHPILQMEWACMGIRSVQRDNSRMDSIPPPPTMDTEQQAVFDKLQACYSAEPWATADW